jgi:hypothetical protein
MACWAIFIEVIPMAATALITSNIKETDNRLRRVPVNSHKSFVMNILTRFKPIPQIIGCIRILTHLMTTLYQIRVKYPKSSASLHFSEG